MTTLTQAVVGSNSYFFLSSNSAYLRLTGYLTSTQMGIVYGSVGVTGRLNYFPRIRDCVVKKLVHPNCFSMKRDLTLRVVGTFSMRHTFVSYSTLSLRAKVAGTAVFRIKIGAQVVRHSHRIVLVTSRSGFSTIRPRTMTALSYVGAVVDSDKLPRAVTRHCRQTKYRLFLPRSVG